MNGGLEGEEVRSVALSQHRKKEELELRRGFCSNPGYLTHTYYRSIWTPALTGHEKRATIHPAPFRNEPHNTHTH